MVLEVDNDVPADVLKEIPTIEGIREAKFVKLG
jgi:hypothetical protein